MPHDDLAAPADELEELAGHGALQPVDAGDTVADLHDGADLPDVDRGLIRLELRSQHIADCTCGDLCHLRLTSLTCGDKRLPHTASSWDETVPSSTRPATLMRMPPRIDVVDVLAQGDGTAGGVGELLHELRAQSVVERDRGGHLGDDDAALGLRDLAEDASELAELVGHAALDHQRHDGQAPRARRPRRRCRAGCRASSRRADVVSVSAWCRSTWPRTAFSDRRKVGVDGVHDVGYRGELEQRPRVGLDASR